MKRLTSIITIFFSILLVSTPSQAGGVLGNLFNDIGKAEVKEGPLVNSYQLEEILTALGKRSIDRNDAPGIPYYGKIQRGTVNDKPKYSAGVTAQIRAYGASDGDRHGYSTQIYGLSAIFYFPDYPKKDPIKVSLHTIKTIPDIADKILAESKVNIAIKEMNGEEDWTIVYGQTVLENTKTTVRIDGNRFLIESTVDISKMNTEQALDFFYSYQSKVSQLNASIDRATKEMREDWEEEQEAREEEAREMRRLEEKKMMAKHWGEISKPDLLTLSIFITDPVESPLSDLGHWEYTLENGAFIEEINYGTYFEMLYILSSRDSAPKENIAAMYKELTELAEKNAPKGTASIHVDKSNYNNFTAITLKYSLDGKPTGEDIWDYTKDFSEFVEDIHDDAEKIRDKYAQKLKYKEFTTLSKEEFIELINDGLEDLKDFGKGAKGYWQYSLTNRDDLGGVNFRVGNFDDHMLLSITYHFGKGWPLDNLKDARDDFEDYLNDNEILNANKFEVIQLEDTPRKFWIKLTFNYEKKSMFSSSAMKGSEIKEKYDDFIAKVAPALRIKFKGIAQEKYDETH